MIFTYTSVPFGNQKLQNTTIYVNMHLHSDGTGVSRWERPISENKYIRLPFREAYIPVIQPSIANGPVLSHENSRRLGTYYNTNEQNLPHLENYSQDNYDNQIVKDVHGPFWLELVSYLFGA